MAQTTFRRLLVWVALACTSAFASAAAVQERTFEEKVAGSDLVVIATVTSIQNGDRIGVRPMATLSVVQTLKGSKHGTIEVLTYSDAGELDPRCCDQGATYMLFLTEAPNGALASAWGAYGMVRVGGAISSLTTAEFLHCDQRPPYGSLIFSGAADAITRLELLARKEEARFARCANGSTLSLVFSTASDADLATSNKLLAVFHEGQLPGLEAGMMGRD